VTAEVQRLGDLEAALKRLRWLVYCSIPDSRRVAVATSCARSRPSQGLARAAGSREGFRPGGGAAAVAARVQPATAPLLRAAPSCSDGVAALSVVAAHE